VTPPGQAGDGPVEVQLAGGVPVDVHPARRKLGHLSVHVSGPVVDDALGTQGLAPRRPFGTARRGQDAGTPGAGQLQDGRADVARPAVDEEGLTRTQVGPTQPQAGRQPGVDEGHCFLVIFTSRNPLLRVSAPARRPTNDRIVGRVSSPASGRGPASRWLDPPLIKRDSPERRPGPQQPFWAAPKTRHRLGVARESSGQSAPPTPCHRSVTKSVTKHCNSRKIRQVLDDRRCSS
jgi:hypothetical protein